MLWYKKVGMNTAHALFAILRTKLALMFLYAGHNFLTTAGANGK
jgi:hypothetical protein